jgi:hypothetical protein
MLSRSALLFFLLAVGNLTAHAQISREYQLKAAFLYNFVQFTEWPTNAFADSNSPLVIGILGTDPFGSILDETVRGEHVHGRPFNLQRWRTMEEIQTCHILFVSQSEDQRLEKILEFMRGKPVLTVSDIENAAHRGAMIRFVTESNRIRLRINLDAVNAANLKVSSKLLRAAELVPQQKVP